MSFLAANAKNVSFQVFPLSALEVERELFPDETWQENGQIG
jgi:hypothetical protein